MKTFKLATLPSSFMKNTPSSRLKWYPIVLILLIGFVQKAQSQIDDPYAKMKREATATPVVQEQLTKVVKKTTDPDWKANSRASIPFRPFDMVDNTGRKVPPTELVTLKNGKKMTAQAYFAELNDIEKKLNVQGYSLRKKENPVVSKTVTDESMLNAQVQNAPRSIGERKTDAVLQKHLSTSQVIGNVTLKPLHEYTPAERQAVDKLDFQQSGKTVISKAVLNPRITTVSENPTAPANPHLLKTINDSNVKEWGFGSASTFRAGLRGELIRSSKIYAFNPASPGKSLSEYRIAAKGRVFGTLFNHSIDALYGTAEFYAPSDSTKPMNAKLVFTLAGISVLNINENYTQNKVLAKRVYARTVDKSFGIEVPIVAGINFTGKIGVRGSAGIEYSAELRRTILVANFSPVAEISGYAQAGVSAGIVGIGVGGELTFIKADVDLNGILAILVANNSKIVLLYSYNFGYDIEMLKGRLYGYIEVCYCFIGCCDQYEHDFFKWAGFKARGTIAEDTQVISLVNL